MTALTEDLRSVVINYCVMHELIWHFTYTHIPQLL